MSDTEYLKQMGAKIKAARKKRGITVRRLGELCQMDYSNLSRMETGQKNAYVLTLRQIAEVLNMDVKDFL